MVVSWWIVAFFCVVQRGIKSALPQTRSYSALKKIVKNTDVVKQLFLPCGTVNYCMNYHSKE